MRHQEPPISASGQGAGTRTRDIARTALLVLIAGLLFGSLAYASITLARGDGRIAAVWVPNALALASLIHFRFRYEVTVLFGMLLGNIAANLFSGDLLPLALGLSLSNTIEIALALILTRKFCGDTPDMSNIDHLSRFAVCAGILAPFASGSVAAGVLAMQGAHYPDAFFKWVLADGLGMNLLAPAALILAKGVSDWQQPSHRTIVEWSGLTILGTMITIMVFAQTSYPLLFLVMPVVLAHAFRLGSIGTAFSVIKVGVVASIFTSMGSGPIYLSDVSLEAKLITLQVFLASAFVTGLPVAAILTGRGRMIEQLANSENQLRILTHNITDAVMQYDTKGVCTYASPSVQSVLGRSRDDFVGNKASDKTHDQALDSIKKVEQRLIEGGSERERLTYRRLHDDDDGNAVYIEADCAISRDPTSGERDGIIVSARDVTERVELEHKLVRARKHAENAAKAKSQFLANMSHEIRTPMNGVLGFAELLQQTQLDEEQHRHMRLIVESGRSMMLLLNDILDISKIEAGQIVVLEEPVAIGHLLSGCVRLHRARALQKEIGLTLQVDKDLPQQIASDGLRLRQIMLNLIGNAVKFTTEGSVNVVARKCDETIEIVIEDSGIGISEKQIEAIFQPFEQADGAISRQFGGTGLGLTISRQLTELLGGSLVAHSTLGAGSSFTVTLPLRECEAPVQNQGDLPDESAVSLPHGGSILLVEDHDINRLLATAMLERCGQSVTCAHDGMQAIKMLTGKKSDERKFDLVLMDIQMPGCDGYAATRAIREAGVKSEDLPIVAMTANAFPEDVAQAKAAGMQAHIAKPIMFENLREVLNRWVPTRIVDDNADAESSGKDDWKQSLPVNGSSHLTQTPAMRKRWQERRSEAVEAVSEAVAQGYFGDEQSEDLVRIVHKLAGTAGLFGEDELGECARNLERALKSDVPDKVSMRLARELLDLA